MRTRLVATLLALLAAGLLAAQDDQEINARFDQLRMVQRFGNDIAMYPRQNLFFTVPFKASSYPNIPRKARSEFDKGNEALQHNEFQKAKERYSAAIAAYPGFALAHLNLGVAEMNLKDVAGARQEFEQSLKLNPQFAPAYQNLGVLHIQEKDLKTAETNLRNANRLDPTDLKSLTLLAYVEALNREFDAAVATARRVHESGDHTGYAYAHMIAATALESSGHIPEAIREYTQFAQEDPKDPRVPAALVELKRLEAQSASPPKP